LFLILVLLLMVYMAENSRLSKAKIYFAILQKRLLSLLPTAIDARARLVFGLN